MGIYGNLTVLGKVTPPDDLTPAIEALGPIGRQHLEELTAGREITPRDLALSADYEREHDVQS